MAPSKAEVEKGEAVQERFFYGLCKIDSSADVFQRSNNCSCFLNDFNLWEFSSRIVFHHMREIFKTSIYNSCKRSSNKKG